MARFTRLKVLQQMIDNGIIPVFYNPDISIAKEIVSACVNGGATCIEMTNRGDGAVDVFRELEAFCRQQHPEAILGVGSIVDAPTAALYISHGANFVVGPTLDEETAVLCNKRKISYSPGCGSATEVHRAHALGVEIVKIFPGSQVGGPAFVKSILGPCPWCSIMPTGGVEPTEESLTAWFNAGIVCAGMGSKLITKDNIKRNDFTTVTENVRQAIAQVKKIRGC